MKISKYMFWLAIISLVAVACSNSESTTNPIMVSSGDNSPFHKSGKHRFHKMSSPISKVFVIVQENRTVDNLFNGFPNANTQSYGMYGTLQVGLRAEPLATPTDIPHTLDAFNSDTGCPLTYQSNWYCPMNEFVHMASTDAYAYVQHSDTTQYWAMAQQYVLGDNMFQSQLDGSYTSHQYLIAARANSATDFPDTNKSCTGLPTPTVDKITNDRQTLENAISACMNYPQTIVGQLASQGKHEWRYYTTHEIGSGNRYWDPFFYLLGGTSGGQDLTTPCQFLTDITKIPYTADVTWITPTRSNSDHAGTTIDDGPNWVATVVNAIGNSPYWNESVIFITWDDWGGWYDHVQPPYKDYDGLGVRIPFIIISPYTAQGRVSHTLYEQASILKYIEDLYGLQPMAAADARANDPAGDVMSNGTAATPRPFQAFHPGSYVPCETDQGSPDDE